MEEPIRKDEILDFEGTKAGFNELIATIEKLSTILHKDLKTSADELLKSLQGINLATKEGQEIVNNAANATGTLVAQEKELTKLDKEKITLQARLNSLNTDTAASNAQLKVQIERKNRELKEEKKLFDSAQGSVNDMRKRLKDLITEYNKLDSEARQKTAPAINKLSSELKKAESAIGNNTRNVGNYRQAIMSAGKQLLGFTSVAAVATLAMNKLKNTFEQTEAGSGFLKSIQTGTKAMWQTFVGGGTFKEILNAFPEAAKAQRQLNAIRKEDREDLVKTAQLEADLKILTYKAADATLGEAEQLRYLNLAREKENELIDFKIKDKEQELNGYKELLKTEKDDIVLKETIAQLEADLISLRSDRSLRLMTKTSNLQNKQQKQEADDLRDFMKATEDANNERMKRREDEYKTFVKSYEDQLKEEQKALEDFNKAGEDADEENRKRHRENYEQEVKEFQDKEEKKKQAVQDSLAIISGSLNTFSDLFEAQKQRELSAAGDNAVKREEIERKYAKKQQALSIGQALINGAMAITEIWKKWAANPVIAGIFTALTSAQTLAQVAVIKSQKFARGGSGVLGGNVHASGGVYLPGIGEAESGEHFSIASRSATNKYGGATLDAIASSINQGKFFEVWSNANKSMGAGDPYTKKMFDLMSKTPIIYNDTDNNTVKEYVALGRKQIIRHRRRKRALAS